jgi:nicotinate-nucleotide pyrophosphorylase (carboxylating)
MTRDELLHRALFRGDSLTLDNPLYLRAVESIVGTLAAEDCEPRDLTVDALFPVARAGRAWIIAREPGVTAGVQEVQWLCNGVTVLKSDGQAFEPGDAILEIAGDVRTLLTHERIVLNILQRMSGIATATRHLQKQTRAAVVGTRKTPWGLLDRRAVHLGGGGTHRLGLGDAILIKNNHLELISLPAALEAAWKRRRGAAFIEVEVRSLEAAREASRTFRQLQERVPDSLPCLLMLDNIAPVEIVKILSMLQREDLWTHVLIEASGSINADTIGAYGITGVDAVSIGALTHSVRAVDLHQRIEC